MRKLRILHVIDSFDLGGGQTALWNLLQSLDRGQFDCEVAAMHGRGVFYQKFQELGIPVHSLAGSKFSPLHTIRIAAMARRFDITHFHLFGSNWIGKPAAAIGGSRIRFNHDQCNDAFRSESRLVTTIDRITNSLSTQVLAVSESTRKFLIEQERLAPEKVCYLPNPVDTEFFRPPTADERKTARKSWNRTSENFVIVAVGRLHPQKNFPTAIESVAGLAESVQWRLLFAGTGPEEEKLRQMAREKGLTERIEFAGHVSDMRSLLWSADALLMPSHYEGLPVALLEAVASGLPAVASSVDGIEEILSNGETGLLAPPSDPPAFTAHLQKLAENRDLRCKLAAGGRKRIVDTFDARTVAEQLGRLYLQAAQREI